MGRAFKQLKREGTFNRMYREVIAEPMGKVADAYKSGVELKKRTRGMAGDEKVDAFLKQMQKGPRR